MGHATVATITPTAWADALANGHAARATCALFMATNTPLPVGALNCARADHQPAISRIAGEISDMLGLDGLDGLDGLALITGTVYTAPHHLTRAVAAHPPLAAQTATEPADPTCWFGDDDEPPTPPGTLDMAVRALITGEITGVFVGLATLPETAPEPTQEETP